ncbi:MAG: DUF1592 domain-containing protein [Myxococcaceae bacterium]|nr:DUF1592 domain-containing protein [Myxococcaceae bacterium]
MLRAILIFLCSLLLGCEAAITAPKPSPSNPTDPSQPIDPITGEPLPQPVEPNPCEGAVLQVPAPVMRRLSPEQLANTWRDVLKDTAAAPLLDAPAALDITELEVERLAAAANELVKRNKHHALVPCNISGAGTAACAEGFIKAFGRAAFRHDLTPEEVAWLTGRYNTTKNLSVTPAVTFKEAIDTVAEVMLQSPQLYYVAERGRGTGVTPLTGYERATRLSYQLWNTTPDTALLDAARDGVLDSADGVKVQAERLLADPRGRTSIRRIASTYLGLDKSPTHPSLEMLTKDAAKYPLDSPALRLAMRGESEALFERAFFDEQGSFKALMTSKKARVNATLARLYGVAGPANDTAFDWVDLGSDRAGLFTRAAFLTSTAAEKQASPTRRGVHIFRHALCRTLGSPPADVDNTPLQPKPGALSVREQIDQRTQGAVCQSCHDFINPIGHTLGHYDAIGAYQVNETGTQGGMPYSVPVDAKATLKAGDIKGEISGGPALAEALAGSRNASDCMADAFLERTLEREAGTAEACLQHKARVALRQTDDMRQVLLTLVSSDEALHINGGQQ